MSKNSDLKNAAYLAGTHLLRCQQKLLDAMMQYGYHSKRLLPYKIKSRDAMVKSQQAFHNLRESENDRLQRKVLQISGPQG